RRDNKFPRDVLQFRSPRIFREGLMIPVLPSRQRAGLFLHQQRAAEEIQDSYEGSHILLYDNDEQVKIFYTPNKGMNVFHKESQIIINPDSSITIQHKDTESIIELIGDTINIVSTSQVNVTTEKAVIDAGAIELGEGATEALIKGNTFQQIFNAHTHIGNLGAPTSPPIIPLNGSELSLISKTK
ncbi:MAG: hypothetical protein RLZZ479_467, partial [Bacteroidota bacterium]